MQCHVLQKWTEAKSRLPLFPIVGTVRCWRSLHGPRHRPSGTGLSSAIMAAPLVAAPSTCAPGHLAAQHARAMRRRTLDCGSDCAPMGHRHSASHRGRTHGYVVSAASEFQAAPTARAYTGRPEVHGPMRLASLTMVARQPPVVMQDAPVGRGGDEPDGGRDRHDGPATPCAGLLTGRALRAREHRLSFCVQATVATSHRAAPCQRIIK